MTLIAVPIAVGDPDETAEALERARGAAERGADLVEWRVDALAECDGALEAIRRLVRESPRPCIVTIRPAWEGGDYGGDEATRLSILEALAASEAPPRYIDLELAALQRSANLRQKALLAVDHDRQPRDLATSLILSSHDFQGRPADLLRRVEAMRSERACAIGKLAWTARSLRDALEAFDLLADRAGPLIALCMGPFGLATRVLAPKFGGFLTFAADAEDRASAPGQPTLESLRDRYRFRAVGPATRVYGVIGWPVEHSLGPDVHNRGFGGVGHDGVYLPLPIAPGAEPFEATLEALLAHPRLDFAGASVTLPHKEHLLRFVAERGGRVDPLARLAGAANTLLREGPDGATLAALNTDAPAAVEAVETALGAGALEGCRVAILGAGGAARAVAAGLADAGASIVVVNRTPDRAVALAAALDGQVGPSGRRLAVAAAGPDALRAGGFGLLVNATSVGMTGGPDPAGSPLPAEVALDGRTAVFDTVYAPARTPLLEAARAAGAVAIGGWPMFVAQARRQFAAWTGLALPEEATAGLAPE